MKKITLRVRWHEATVEAFIASHGDDVDIDEVFLPTNNPLPAETPVTFEFLLADGEVFFSGRGVISAMQAAADGRCGMYVRYTELCPLSRQLVAQVTSPPWDEETPICSIDASLLETSPERLEDEDHTAKHLLEE